MAKDELGMSDPWIPYARQCIEQSDIDAVVSTLKSDFVTQGPAVGYFEDGLREFTGARHAVAVSSGTAALHLAYQGLGVREGGLGIVPSITFAATANALRYCGADPVFCDVDAKTGIANPSHFKAAFASESAVKRVAKVIVPVSYSGRMCDLESLSRLAAKEGASVVEDAAHSLGATFNGVRSASCQYSDAAILSFHPVKHVCAGEGGAITTNDAVLARRLRALRSHGIERPDALVQSEGPWAYDQTDLGSNYRMTDIQASLGLSQLKRIGLFLEKRKRIAQRYHGELSGEPMARFFELPEFDEGCAWHLYVVRFRSSHLRRQAFEFLREKRIGTQVHYRPLYRNSYYKEFARSSCPGAESFYSGCLSLPLYPAMSERDQSRVVQALVDFCDSKSK